MSERPPIERLKGYLGRAWEIERHPCYLLVDDDLALRDAQGQASHYGFSGLRPGMDMREALRFLEGLELPAGKILQLPILELDNGLFAEVHAVRLRNGWGLAFTDATEQHERQRRYQQTAHELALAQRELEAHQAQLESALEARTRFMGRMSHEFRTPLSSILGFAELAQEDMGDKARLQADLEAIGRGAHYLLSLVDNLLDHAVLEQGELIIHPAACDPNALVNDLDQLFQPAARQQGLTLAWWLEGGLPSRLWLDETRLRQVLVNLIGNAIKFTREGGITVSMDWSQDRLEVAVEDTGPGIPPEEQERLFDAFNQGSSAQGKRGAGLGLSISRELVRRMGGDMMLESRPGRGTTVRFHLAAPARQAQGGGENDLRDRRILLLERDGDSRQLLSIFLRGAGARVLLADTQDQAVEHLSERPELVVAALLEEPHHRLLLKRLAGAGYQGPVVAVGTADDAALLEKVRRAGYADLICKPVRRSEFVQRIADLLPEETPS